MGEAGDRLEQRHHARVTEAERGGPLAAFHGRALQAVERVLRQDTVVADALDFEELAVDLLAEVAQVREIADALGDVEVLRVVDRGFGSERVLLFEILLDVRRLVFDVETGLDPVGDDSGAIAEGRRGCGARETQRKQEADAMWSPEVEIFADDGFEEVPALDGAVKDLGETHFELPDREVMVEPSGAVLSGEWPRQAVRPPVEERLDVRRAEGIAPPAVPWDQHTRESHCPDFRNGRGCSGAAA